MSYYDDQEACSHCTARFRQGGCTRWGTELPPCERDYEEPEECEEEEEEDEDAEG